MSYLRGLFASSPALMLAILGLGCAGDVSDRVVDVYVHRSECTPECNPDRFELFLVRGGCVFAWAVTSGQDVIMDRPGLEQGTAEGVARCGSESCTRCSASKIFGPDASERVDLELQLNPTCTDPRLVTGPCADCRPTNQAYCDGNRRVTCVEGRTQLEECPLGCVAGACGPCTKTRWWADSDRDTYGDPNAWDDACEAPKDKDYVSRPGDCDDTDPEAHPKQDLYFAHPTSGTKNFDYNCAKGDEPQWSKPEAFCIGNALQGCGGGGWRGVVPVCGDWGTLVTCVLRLGFCISTPQQAQQLCH